MNDIIGCIGAIQLALGVVGCAEINSLDRTEAARMAWHVELWYETNALGVCIGFQFSNVVLRIVASLDSCERFCQLRVQLALHAEAAHVRGMQVQHVHFDCRHGVQQVLHQVDREKTTARIDHQTTPVVLCGVSQRDSRVRQDASDVVSKLHQRLHAVHSAIDCKFECTTKSHKSTHVASQHTWQAQGAKLQLSLTEQCASATYQRTRKC